MAFTIAVSGTTHTVDVDADTPLLLVLLRIEYEPSSGCFAFSDMLGLTGTKFGCASRSAAHVARRRGAGAVLRDADREDR